MPESYTMYFTIVWIILQISRCCCVVASLLLCQTFNIGICMKNVFFKVLMVVLTAMFTGSAVNAAQLTVTSTAYNSLSSQTDSTPNIAAWGDRLRPGMKAIAVSYDLMKVHGLTRGDKVTISGLPGEYTVLDKMHPRWRKKVDVYMGKDVRAAKRWGKRKVRINW